MKTFYKFLLTFLILSFIGITTVQAQDKPTVNSQKKSKGHGQNFVDKDGDGYNDNAPDHDGDGIPNGLDPDWKKFQKEKNKHKFIDLDGDGINDNIQGQGKKQHDRQRKNDGKMESQGSSTGNKSRQQHGQQKKHGHQ